MEGSAFERHTCLAVIHSFTHHSTSIYWKATVGKAVSPATKVQCRTKQIKILGADNPDAICSNISGETDPEPVSRSLRRLSLGGAELEQGKKGQSKEISCLAPLHTKNCLCVYIYVYIGTYTCTYLHVYKYKLFEHLSVPVTVLGTLHSLSQ